MTYDKPKEDDSFEDAQVGDRVYVRPCSDYDRPLYEGTIVRLTKTRVMVDFGRRVRDAPFQKKNGRQVGNSWGDKLLKPTPELLEEFRRYEAKVALWGRALRLKELSKWQGQGISSKVSTADIIRADIRLQEAVGLLRPKE